MSQRSVANASGRVEFYTPGLCKGLISILVDFPGTVQSIYIARFDYKSLLKKDLRDAWIFIFIPGRGR